MNKNTNNTFFFQKSERNYKDKLTYVDIKKTPILKEENAILYYDKKKQKVIMEYDFSNNNKNNKNQNVKTQPNFNELIQRWEKYNNNYIELFGEDIYNYYHLFPNYNYNYFNELDNKELKEFQKLEIEKLENSLQEDEYE